MLRIVLDIYQELLNMLERASNTGHARKNTIGLPRRKVGRCLYWASGSWQGSGFWGTCPLPPSPVLMVGQREKLEARVSASLSWTYLKVEGDLFKFPAEKFCSSNRFSKEFWFKPPGSFFSFFLCLPILIFSLFLSAFTVPPLHPLSVSFHIQACLSFSS